MSIQTTEDIGAQCIELGLTVQQPALAPAEQIRRGKGYVNVQWFGSYAGLSSMKAELKKANPTLSAKGLSRKVNEILRGERDVRSQLAVAWVQGRLASGDVPVIGEVGSSGSTLRMRSLPQEVSIVVQKAPEPKTAEEAEAKIAELQALLATFKK